jgi:hypothetical protein
MWLGRRHSWQQLAVDEQAPDLTERDDSNEFLDVDAAVAQRTALAVGLGNLGRERDYAFKARLNFRGHTHRFCSWGTGARGRDKQAS